MSLAGGQFPRWRRDGKELFFLSPDRKLMASSVKAGHPGDPGPRRSFEAAAPQPLFDARVPTVPPGFNLFPYEVAADGKRFLMIRSGAETTDTPLTVVVNWLAGVRR